MIFWIIAILAFLVLAHEWGHYIAAKKQGIAVEEFGIGYPPRLFRLFVHDGTEYTLNLLPFGGFVRLAGDDAETIEKRSDEKKKSESVETHAKGTLFPDASIPARLIVTYGGVFINTLIGIALFAAIYSVIGVPHQLEYPRIDIVSQNSPAEKGGLQKGDELRAVNGVVVRSSTAFIEALSDKKGQTVEILFNRNQVEQRVQIYIRTEEETPPNEGSLGVSLYDIELTKYPWWQMPFRGVFQGLKDSWMFANMILGALQSMVRDLFHGVVPKDVSGPIGIVHIAQKEKIMQQGWISIANFTAMISINLAVMNILPIPALDGGRAAFLLIEKFVGKRRRARWEQVANTAGMSLLLLLLVLVSFRDVVNIIR